MKYGFSTRVYHRFGWSLSEILAHVNQVAGVCELWLEPPFLPGWRTSIEKSSLERIKEVLVVRNLDVSIHAAKYNLNLASLNPAVRKTARLEVEKALSWAIELGAKVVTFHPGGYKFDKEKSMAELVLELSRLDATASELDLDLCIENPAQPESLCQCTDEVYEILSQFENIKLTVDLAHLKIVDEDSVEFIDKLSDYIRHVHISDVDVKKRKHLALGEKKIDYTPELKKLNEIGFDGYFIIEGMGEEIIESSRAQIERFKEMAGNAGYNL